MTETPDDLVEMGRVIGAFGVRGQLKVDPFAGPDSSLNKIKQIWLKRADKSLECRVMNWKVHSDSLVLSLEGFADRDLAAAWKGASIWVSRRRFPATDPDEVYWIDLIGCKVYGHAGVLLGSITAVEDHGGGAFLKVQAPEGLSGPAERLIPYVAHYITETDLAQRQLKADWDPEWD
ncbi:MAG: ribosome maturation factor RimM [Burkholderiaceae bacterium]